VLFRPFALLGSETSVLPFSPMNPCSRSRSFPLLPVSPVQKHVHRSCPVCNRSWPARDWASAMGVESRSCRRQSKELIGRKSTRGWSHTGVTSHDRVCPNPERCQQTGRQEWNRSGAATPPHHSGPLKVSPGSHGRIFLEDFQARLALNQVRLPFRFHGGFLNRRGRRPATQKSNNKDSTVRIWSVSKRQYQIPEDATLTSSRSSVQRSAKPVSFQTGFT
jgi:hypothetical protein